MKKLTIKKRFRKIMITSLIAMQCFVTVSYGDLIYENEYQIIISEGIVHKKVVQTYDSGVQSINLIIADIASNAVDFEILYNDVSGFVNRETLSKLVKQNPNTVAAVNADFFSMANPSYSMGPMVSDGKVISSTYYDSGKMAAFMVDRNQMMVIDYLKSGVVIKNETTGNNSTGYSINKYSKNYTSPIVMTNEYRKNTQGQAGTTLGTMTEVIVNDDVVTQVRKGQKGTAVPENGYAVAASGAKGDLLASTFSVGDRLELKTNMENNYPDIMEAVGGGTMILKDGMLAPLTHKISGRSQRTAIGITYDRKIVFMTVDGRKAPYIGMQETEVADFLRKQNVKDAMMFDGGGSTEMIVNGKITNDLSEERKILNGVALVNNRTRGSLSKLEAVLETSAIFQGDKIKLIVKGFDSNMNPVDLGNMSVSGSGISAAYSNGYVSFQSGGSGKLEIKSGSASTSIPVNVAAVNLKDPKKTESMTSYDVAVIPDALKDKDDILSQAINGRLVQEVNSKAKVAVNSFNKNQELSDNIKISKESVYKGAQIVDRDGVKYIGLDISNGIGGISGQWQTLKSGLSGSGQNVIIMMNSKMNLGVSEKAVFRKVVQDASSSKNIFVVSKGEEYSSYAEGNVSYITMRDFSSIKAGKEENYKLLVFKKTGTGMTYGFLSLFQ
ncbi:MAG: phosphodiester glycosidase family protein [Proteocatella sp.]